MNTCSPLLCRTLSFSLLAGAVLFLGTGAKPGDDDEGEVRLEESRIFFEYNSTDNDLGVHVFLDGEDWKTIRIFTPEDRRIFEVSGKGPYARLGITELFFEGAEPTLDEFPLEDFLPLFPEGVYEFEGKTVTGQEIEGEGELTHAIPDGPDVQAQVMGDDFLRISWSPVTGPAPGFPNRPIDIVAYQVIVDDNFQVTLPGSATSLTVSPEYVASLRRGRHEYEVLAIERSGNQSLTETFFVK